MRKLQDLVANPHVTPQTEQADPRQVQNVAGMDASVPRLVAEFVSGNV